MFSSIKIPPNLPLRLLHKTLQIELVESVNWNKRQQYILYVLQTIGNDELLEKALCKCL